MFSGCKLSPKPEHQIKHSITLTVMPGPDSFTNRTCHGYPVIHQVLHIATDSPVLVVLHTTLQEELLTVTWRRYIEFNSMAIEYKHVVKRHINIMMDSFCWPFS